MIRICEYCGSKWNDDVVLKCPLHKPHKQMNAKKQEIARNRANLKRELRDVRFAPNYTVKHSRGAKVNTGQSKI